MLPITVQERTNGLHAIFEELTDNDLGHKLHLLALPIAQLDGHRNRGTYSQLTLTSEHKGVPLSIRCEIGDHGPDKFSRRFNLAHEFNFHNRLTLSPRPFF